MLKFNFNSIIGYNFCQIKLLILFLYIILLFSCSDTGKQQSEVLCTKTNYGTSQNNEIILYHFKNSKSNNLKPVILFVHGGGWNTGSYSDWVNNQLVESFSRNDIVFTAINYSLSPFPCEINNQNRVKHPAHIRDVAKAIKWLYNNAEKYGIDKNKIFIMGHSAGAHLVSLLATNDKYIKEVNLNLSNIAGVISLDAGAYLTNDKELLFPSDNDIDVDENYKNLKYLYYNAFTTDNNIQDDACPFLYIDNNKSIPPFLLIFQGENVPYRYFPNMTMAAKLKKNKIKVVYLVVNEYNHLQIMSYIGTNNDRVKITSEIMSFVISK